ncbi:restriction endonuclease subunit S [[Clostridium] cellulosi]
MTEWRECKLKDVCKYERISINPQKYKILQFVHYSFPAFDNNKTPEIQFGGQIKSSKYIVKKGYILYNKLNVRFKRIWNINFETPENSICSSEFLPILATKCNQDYLYYFLCSDELTDTMANSNTGTSGSHQRIDPNFLMKYDILLPPLPEQKAIAEVLSSLDDKIDLLTRQNKTLEDLAQAYFRKWFIEDASDKWEVVPISEKFDVLLGGTPSRKIESYWTNGTIGWINSGKINEFRIIEASEYITEEALNNSSAKLLPAGTTVLAITGATLGKISMVLRSFAANQSVIGLVPKAELSNNFIFLWLKENINALISMQTGGAQQHINSNDVKSFDVIVPDTVALSLFRRKIDPLMLKISQNCFQINTLNKLRDTFLPKLISGEIRVKM